MKPLTKKHYRMLRTLYEVSDGTCHTSCLAHGLHASAMTLVRRGCIWKQDRRLARPLYGMHPEGIPAAIKAWKALQPGRESGHPQPPETPMSPERYRAVVAFLRGPKPPPTTREEWDAIVKRHWGDNPPLSVGPTRTKPPSPPNEMSP